MTEAMTLHVYKMNDCDWVIASSAQEAASFYSYHTGNPPDECYPDARLTDSQLSSLVYTSGEDTGETFLEVKNSWVENGNQVPFIFATTEY